MTVTFDTSVLLSYYQTKAGLTATGASTSASTATTKKAPTPPWQSSTQPLTATKAMQTLLAGRKTVVEGHRSTEALYGLCRERGINAPILAEIHAILFEHKKPADALHALMTRELKRETAAPFPKK